MGGKKGNLELLLLKLFIEFVSWDKIEMKIPTPMNDEQFLTKKLQKSV